MSDLPPSEVKARLRAEAFARRDALDPAFRAEASRCVAARVLGIPALQGLSPVGGFWPIRSEIDVTALLEALHARGQEVCLPVVARPAMLFRLWQPGDPLVTSGFGLRHPPRPAAEMVPRAMIVPLAAFDRRGGRIGFGKGHYDTAIGAIERLHPVLTVGVAFSVQEVAQVPMEPHDRPMDMIATEAELIRPASV
jgi:5-formyltetrahydrofolate cyclo-ligase